MCAHHQQLKSWIGMPYPRVLNKPLQRNTCLDNSDVLKEVVLKEDVPAAVRVLLSLIYKKVPVLDAWKDNVSQHTNKSSYIILTLLKVTPYNRFTN